MTIYRGLNVQKALNDVDDPVAALKNLGLDQRDLDLVSGLTAAGNDITKEELHTLAGLVDDQKNVLFGLSSAATAMSVELNAMADFKQPLEHNYRLNNQLQAGAIKYRFYDFATGTSSVADISTSRVSSWSTIGENRIAYGGEVEVIGNTLTFNSLATTVAPIPKLFRAEVPTHRLKLQVNGTEVDFLAMKGIPLIFNSFMRNVDLSAAVNELTDSLGAVPYVWRITNQDDGRVYSVERSAGTVDNPTIYQFRDTASKARKVEFFYNPNNILNLRMTGMSLSDWTDVQLPNLKRLDISSNDFYQLPSFRSTTDSSTKTALPFKGLAPALENLIVTNNNLTRARSASGTVITATEQLNTLPTTIKSLEINGAFSDSTTIDLRDHINLESFYMSSYYDRSSQRSMTGGTVTPRIAPDKINSYQIYNQPYTQLSRGLMTSTTLTYLWFPWCGVEGGESATFDTGGASEDLSIASNVMTHFLSYGNPHNVVNMAAKATLLDYTQQYAYIGLGRLTSANPTARSFVGKFTGCVKLSNLSFYGSSGITGSISTGLKNLPELTSFDGRFTGITGRLVNDSFDGTPKIQAIYLAASGHDEADFFGVVGSGGGQVFNGTASLRTLYVYGNKLIRGQMPDMSKLKSLSTVYINNTGLSGPLPAFSGLEQLSYIRMDYTKDGVDAGFSGSIPRYALSRLNYLLLSSNNLSGPVPKFDCPFLYQFNADDNQLTGVVPDLSGCPRIQRVYLNNNRISGYIAGSLSTNTSLSLIDLSNNRLTSPVGPIIIDDLLKNWAANPRSGVTVNLLGNAGLSEKTTREDGTEGEFSTSNKLDTIRSKGWTIIMDIAPPT
jgi:Leucine-rich repeat (LRR) protein